MFLENTQTYTNIHTFLLRVIRSGIFALLRKFSENEMAFDIVCHSLSTLSLLVAFSQLRNSTDEFWFIFIQSINSHLLNKKIPLHIKHIWCLIRIGSHVKKFIYFSKKKMSHNFWTKYVLRRIIFKMQKSRNVFQM